MKKTLVSLFKGYSDVVPTEVSLQQIVELIAQDAGVNEQTQKHRYYLQQGMNTAATRAKSDCPCFAVAVRFKNGKQQKDITHWTRLSLVDIDHTEPADMDLRMKLIREDPHTLLAYRTISGQGIRIIVTTDYTDENKAKNIKLYTQTFARVNQYYADLLHCECDLKCKNITRLSGLAHDPDVFFNPQAQPFHVEKAKEKTTTPTSSNQDKELKKVVAQAKLELEEAGIVYAPHAHNDYIMRMGYLLNLYGVSLEAATHWANGQFHDYEGDIAAIFRSCYRNTEDHATRKLPRKAAGIHQQTANNLANAQEIEGFLDTQAQFRYNVITRKCEYRMKDEHDTDNTFKELDDRLVNSLWSRMSKDVKPLRIGDLRNVLQSEYVPPFNPLVSYFESLPPWDGTTDHMGRLAATVHTTGDAAVFEQCFKKWLVASVASWLDHNVVNQEILVLIGAQGSYKTSWFNELLPKCLEHYFYVKSNNNRITKGDVITLAEFAFICLEEMDEMRPADMNQLKAMVTMKSVNEREAYSHYKEHRPHLASYCGTSNNTHFLSDPTGSRRWLPFEIVSIDNPFTHPFDHDAVYAQAYALWKSGFRYWFDAHEVKAVNQRNTHFEAPNLEQELILTYFRHPLPGEECVFLSTAQILARINGGIRQILSPTRIGLAMKQAGFELMRTNTQRGYRVVELKGEEIYRSQCAIAHYIEQLPDKNEH